MRWAGHVARIGKMMFLRVWWRNLRERDHLVYPDLDERIILRWIFKKLHGGHRCIFWLRERRGGGHL